MKKQLLFFIGLLMSFSISAQSELKVFEEWASGSGSQSFYQKSVTRTSGTNVYVAGSTLNSSGNYDILVAKYNSSGVRQWIVQYNGTGNGEDGATDLVVNGINGDVYVTGVTTTSTNIDMVTIKYNSSGVQQWLTTYNGTGSLQDIGTALALDQVTNNLFACGSSYNASGNLDYVTIKYNTTTGAQVFANVYAHTSGLEDVPVKLATGITFPGSVRHVIVTGAVQTGTTSYSVGAIKYNQSTGATMATTISAGGSSGITQVFDMVKDASDNIYIAGGIQQTGQGYDYCVIKLNSSLGIVWQKTYSGADSLEDMAKAIQVDASGNVYVTGYSTTDLQGTNIVTLKYNSSGALIWTKTYNDAINGNDEAVAMAMDAAGKIYITGWAQTAMNSLDYYTMKYDTAGTVLWSINYDGDKRLKDRALNIATDSAGTIFVTGTSETAAGTSTYKTIKYIEKDIITPTDFNSETPLNSFAYYQNKGQLLNTNDTLAPEVKYYTNLTTPSYFIGDQGYSFVFAHVDTAIATQDTLHRVDFVFKGNVNSSAKVYPLEQQESYINYFLGHIPEGITGIHGHQRLVTPGLYNNIDLEYSSNQKGLKYYFIIKPGGSPSNIQMEFVGASSFNLNGTTNELTINSSIGSITFDRPAVYQVNSSNVIVPITGWTADWQTNGATNKYKFNLGAYDSTKVLVIEVDMGNAAAPTTTENLEWSTYIGGTADDYLNEATTDAVSDLYVSGASTSALFPNATGFQTSNNSVVGMQDAVVIRFNYLGQTIWATFVGGSGMEISGGLTVNSAKSIYLVGSTNSANFPTTGGNPGGGATYNTSLGGSGYFDGFICKIDSSGAFAPWRTYYGGSRGDFFNAAKLDGGGNLFIVGQTQSSLTQIHPGSTYTQTCISGGAGSDEDGMILKFNNAGVPQWITCYGGSAPQESVNNLDFDNSGNLYVVGSAYTTGTGFPTLDLTGTADYYDNSLFGGSDAFIAKFTNAGVRTWATLFGGNSNEGGSAIVVSKTTDEIFVAGNSISSDTSLVKYKSGAYNQAYNATNYDCFFLKLNTSLGREWASFYGGIGHDYINSMVLDNNNILFATGISESTNFPNFPPTNPTGVYDQTYTTGKNSYVLAFNAFQKNVWRTYLGGSKDDYGYAIALDNFDQLFVAGKTNSDTAATDPFPLNDDLGVPYFKGYWQGANGLDNDGTITRFDAPYTLIIGMNEINDIENGLLVYPNPANNELNIQYSNHENSSVNFLIYNIMGSIVKSSYNEKQNGTIFHTFDISDFADGVYFIQIQDNNKTITKKFIKQ